MREDIKENVYKLICGNPEGLKTSDISKILSLSVYQAYYYLQNLDREGSVIRSTYRKGSPVTWRWK
ncbi:FaeA/PapI family transcriptional regulator [Escherichia coli]|uniref:FaeA/PapI family transcriptional regulator n=1 Tax=Escherichia coli TaxID=562 RepID=UPI0015825135